MLRIEDLVNGVFLDMPAMLALLRPEAEALGWRVLALGEVVPDPAWALDLPAMERAVWESERGLNMSFDELSDFASRVRQVIDGLFVGATGNLPSRDDSDDEVLSKAEMTLAAVDSAFWLVSAPENVLRRYENGFEHVTEENPPFVWRGP